MDKETKEVSQDTDMPSEKELRRYEKLRDYASWVVDYYQELKNLKANWDNMYEELAEMFLPRKSTVYDYAGEMGGERRVRLFDITGVISNDELASSLHFTLTNPTIQFFEYTTGDYNVDQIPAVSKYLQEITQIDHNILHNSNFQTEIHECYLDLGAFGTQALRIDEDDETIVNFTSRPIFEFVCDENHKGFVDTVGRTKTYTGRQLLQKFGGAKLFDKSHYWGAQKEQMLQAIQKRPLDKFKVIELFIPSKDIRACGFQPSNREFTNVFVLEDYRCLLKQDGYFENIYAVSRWSKSSDEVYGRGPGHKAMPAMLMLNELARLVVQAGQLATKPPVLIPDDGTYGGFNIYPGAINWYRAGTRDEITAFNPNPNVAVADWIVEKMVNQIRQAFMLDKFQIPQHDRMTREEVLQRQQENLRFTSPILGRQEQESLTTILKRVHAIGDRRGIYPPAPEELQDRNLEVRYASQVSRVQKSALAENASMFAGEVIQISQQTQNPDVLDNIDWDKYVAYQAFTRSAPSSILTSSDQKEETRGARQAQMQEQMDAQMALQDAQVAEQASKASSNLASSEAAMMAEEV